MADPTLPDPIPSSPQPTVLFPDRPPPRYQLPTPLTSFIGREWEVAAVVALLRDPACACWAS
jgi:hypothetical protein